MNKELIIVAHRGRSDIFPQNTLQALQNGLISAHFSQFDVLLTKDNQLIVFHDRYLSKLTNIAHIQLFKERKTINNLDQFGTQPHLEWWVKDFTLEQLQLLQVHQKNQCRPQLKHIKYKISTLQQLFIHCLQFKKNNPKNKSGLLLQIKSERQNLIMAERDYILLEKIKECLQKYHLFTKAQTQQSNLPVIIQSFNHQILQKWAKSQSDLPINHLYYNQTELNQEIFKNQITSKSIGIGISQTHANQRIVNICRNIGLKIFYWTVVDDAQKQKIPFQKQNAKQVYEHLIKLGIQGIITDFPENCKKYLIYES